MSPSSPYRPHVPVCFSCNKALYTSYTVICRRIRLEFKVFDSQKRFNKLQTFDFDLSFVIILSLSATFVKCLFNLTGDVTLAVIWGFDVALFVRIFMAFQTDRESFFEATKS